MPEWVRRLGTAALVVGPRGRVSFMNRRAEELLGCTWAECRERHSSDLVRSIGASGRRIYKRDLAVRGLAKNTEDAPLLQLHCSPESGGRRWIQMTSIPFQIEAEGLHVLHTFHDIEREHRLKEHAQLVAHRHAEVRVSTDVPPRSVLTARERDVLDHLTCDEDPQRVAANLFRSPATVRNHIRHILKKLGAHSIDEAVALHLLLDPPAR